MSFSALPNYQIWIFQTMGKKFEFEMKLAQKIQLFQRFNFSEIIGMNNNIQSYY